MLRCDDKHGRQSSTMGIHEECIYRKVEIMATKEIQSGSMPKGDHSQERDT
jgi:hypothetical protein